MDRPAAPARRPAQLLALLVTLLAAGLVVSTWRVLSQTWDEGVHIACGMEWLDKGTFTLEELTPPLARVAGALGPWLSGIHSFGNPDIWSEGNDILHAGGHYWRTLAAARAGELPFIALLAWSVWAWTRRRAGPWAAFAAVLAAMSLPTLLGNAGLAATDFPLAATSTFAFWRLEAWLDAPDRGRAVCLGVAAALATLTKFSAIPFLVMGGILLLGLRLLLARDPEAPRMRLILEGLRSGPWLVLALGLTLWAGYRFSLDPLLRNPARAPGVATRLVGETGPLHDAAAWLVLQRVFPARAMFLGLKEVPKRNAIGHKTFFDGRIEYGGRPEFYPRMLLVKTPLPFMALLAIAIGLAAFDPKSRRSWLSWSPVACSAVVLWTGVGGNLILGTRLILAMLPPLAVCVGVGTEALWRRGAFARMVVVALFGWQLVGTLRAWPDEMSWFNELGPREPMWLTTSADLDYAQDLGRMCDTLRARGVARVWMAYSGSADLARQALPGYRLLEPQRRVSGWVAISANTLMAGRWEDRGAQTLGYRWLLGEPCVARVGRSMFLYRVPGPDSLGP